MKAIFLVALLLCSTIASGAEQQVSATTFTLSNGYLTISADQLVADTAAGTITARGNVKLEVKVGLSITSDEAEVEFKWAAGLVEGVVSGKVHASFPTQNGAMRTVDTNVFKFSLRMPGN